MTAAKKQRVDDVAKAYDAWAAVYDTDGNPLVAIDSDVVPSIYGAHGPRTLEGKRALDVGCGTGRHTAMLVNAGAVVVGVDASAGMLARARERLGVGAGATFVHHAFAPHTRMPFDDGSFDVVVCALVLEHVADLAPPIADIARVLKRGGAVVVSDIHARMRERTQANFTDPVTGDDVLPPSFPHEAGDYRAAAAAAGLDVVDVGEHAGTAALAARFPRATKYVGLPMLVVLHAVKPPAGAS